MAAWHIGPFSGALEQSTAENLNDYHLIAAGKDGKFGTGDDKPLTLVAPHYNASANTVTLTPQGKIPNQLLRLSIANGRERFDIREYMRPAVFVPESKRLNVLLKDFRRNRNHMALVVDEYGGVSGLVTIEDVIEQIVGEIDDEFDVEDDQNIRRDAEAQFTVRGVTRIEEFNHFFGAQLPEGQGVDTIAGLLLKQLGRLPRRGETASIDGFEFRVLRADRRRIDALRVLAPRDVLPPPDERPAGGTS